MDAVGSIGYLIVLVLLIPFGAHRLRLVWLRFRRPPRREFPRWVGELPVVTVQLPVYNEANVVERLIDAVCALDHPRDRLEVQVLDDSDDETVELARARVAEWRSRGIDITHVRRGDRTGFKAGALAHGTALSRGEFLLVLDADFVAPPDLVARLLAPFLDEEVGAVQAAWAHLDGESTWLRRAQSLFLDAHFAIEHEARYRAGLFFNFNGSAGMWRRSCIDAVGGWRSDTLTEDIDLSYRAQLEGWRFAYLDDLRVPGELPASMRAVEIQQERWTQGGIQSARLLLPSVWRSRLGLEIKLEATAHLLGHVVHPLTLLLGSALAVAGWAGLTGVGLPGWIHGVALGMATLPFVLFYGSAAALRGVRAWAIPLRVLQSMILWLGLGVPLTGAVLRGALGRPAVFARTPKDGFARQVLYGTRRWMPSDWVRASVALALGGAVVNLAVAGVAASVPFTALFALGYVASTAESLRGPRTISAVPREQLAGE